MRSRRREDAWNQEDTVEVLVTEDVDDDQDVRETARRIVNDSHAMAAIRRTVEERGLDPIWVQLITEFGTMMYLQGWRSHWPPSSGVGERRRR